MRREQWLSQENDATLLLEAFHNQQMGPLPALEVLLPYDYITFLFERVSTHRRFYLFELNKKGYEYAAAATLERQQRQDYGDAFVAVAAAGHLPVLVQLTQQRVQVDVDVAKMMEVACLHGHWEVSKWLCESSTWANLLSPARTTAEQVHLQVQRGALCAIKTLATKPNGETLVETMKQQVCDVLELGLESEPATLASGRVAPPEPQQEQHQQQQYSSGLIEHTAAAANAVAVLTNGSLMARIGEYQEAASQTVERFQKKSRLYREFRLYRGLAWNLGIVPRIAIIEGNLCALKNMYYVSRSQYTAMEQVMHDFHHAMHFAACEGRLEMLKWLHSLPGEAHKCRKDTMAMAVRCGWPQVVEWLHFHCPESGQTVSAHCVNDAAR